MAASLSGQFEFQAFTDAGAIAANYRLYTYVATTTTFKTAYTDAAALVAHTYTADGIGGQYIALNARGELPAPLFLTAGAYDIALKRTDGSTVWTLRATPSSDGLAAFVAQLADPTSSANGASLVGYRGPQSPTADSVAERLSWDVYVTDPQFNAIGDGATDSTAALALAVSFVNALYDASINSLSVARFPRLIFPPSLGFVSSATLNIRAGVEVLMQSPLLVTGAAGTPIIGIDLIDSRGIDFQAPRGTSSVFDVRRVTQSTWGSESDIGVRGTQYHNEAFFKRVSGFTVGADICLGYGRVKLGDIRDAKIGLKVTGRTSPSNFTNQARIQGGAFSCASGVGAGLAR